MRGREDGGVTVSFSDGSDDLHVSRREFMRITGVAAATAAMAGAACRNPKENIVPYVDRPETIRIGKANYYASVCSGCSAQCGVLVETRAGRPIKVEGNPEHPVSRGATCARGQAAYRRLYDPDRQRSPLKVAKNGRNEELDWSSVDNAVITALDKVKSGGGVRLLTSTMTGSAQQALIDQITSALPNAKHYTFDPLTSQALITASNVAYGFPHVPHYRFDQANVVVSLGSDFLGTWLSPVEFTKQFSSRRKPGADMSRLVAFEGYLSLTGSNADDRYMVRYSDLPYVAMGLAQQVAQHSPAGNPAVRGALKAFTPEAVANKTGVAAEVIKKTAAELAKNRGKSLVIAGGQASTTDNGVELETAVNLLNYLLGNVGATVERDVPSNQAVGGFGDLQALVKDIDAGKVDVLIIDRTNPVYAAPPEVGIAKAIAKVPMVVSTSDRVDETAFYATYLATGNHDMESWGDSNPLTGVYSIRQPTIRPLYNTRSFEESLMVWFGDQLVPELKRFLQTPKSITELEKNEGNFQKTKVAGHAPTHDPGAWYRYLREHWRTKIYPKADAFASFDEFWDGALRKGVFVVPHKPHHRVSMNVAGVLRALPKAMPKAQATKPGDLSSKELHMFASLPLYDGRNANDGHLQELPDPITKHAWGSYIAVSPKTFKEADLALGDIVKMSLKVGGKRYERLFPVLMQPGVHDDVVAIPLGYGRTRCGVVGSDIGVNGFELTHVKDGRQIMSGFPVKLAKTGDQQVLAVEQGSQVIDLHQRPIIATATLAEYQKDPQSGVEKHQKLETLWEEHDYRKLSGIKWGMSIDMTTCTGCNACVTACQEENNIPVVGRQGIIEGREMYWMRIDRYYKLPGEDPEFRKLRYSPTDDPMFARHPYVAMAEYMDNPRVLHQPMLCQHCEHAPCETVCPVAATMHSSDGLNQMAYNRCVGTRYCSNNCPYKVRRFNWYNYSQDRSDSFMARFFPEMKEHARLNVAEPLPLGMNPEVIVRSRGVMEKCTFCVQRIRRAKWQAKKEGRSKLHDGDVVTACQQVCPADAIKFGNLLDEQAVVTQNHRSPRALAVLADVGTRPSIAYLSSIWNTQTEEA